MILFGPAQEAAVKGLVDYAEKHPIHAGRMLRIVSGAQPPPGGDPKHALGLPGGLRVVLSIEDHPGGWMRHASFSVPERGRLPCPHMIEFLLPWLGFKNGLQGEVKLWVESYGEGDDAVPRAVNVVEKTEDPDA